MAELKPCPFCGGKAGARRGYDVDGYITYSIVCHKCGTGIFRAVPKEWVWDAYTSPSEAAEAWNRRAGEQE